MTELETFNFAINMLEGVETDFNKVWDAKTYFHNYFENNSFTNEFDIEKLEPIINKIDVSRIDVKINLITSLVLSFVFTGKYPLEIFGDEFVLGKEKYIPVKGTESGKLLQAEWAAMLSKHMTIKSQNLAEIISNAIILREYSPFKFFNYAQWRERIIGERDYSTEDFKVDIHEENICDNWEIHANTKRGKTHDRCDDYSAVFTDDDDTWFACSADGVGSCSMSHIGSRIACEAFHTVLKNAREKLGDGEALKKYILESFRKDALDFWQNSIIAQSDEKNISFSEYRSTFLFTFKTKDFILCGMIGDGNFFIKKSRSTITEIVDETNEEKKPPENDSDKSDEPHSVIDVAVSSADEASLSIDKLSENEVSSSNRDDSCTTDANEYISVTESDSYEIISREEEDEYIEIKGKAVGGSPYTIPNLEQDETLMTLVFFAPDEIESVIMASDGANAINFTQDNYMLSSEREDSNNAVIFLKNLKVQSYEENVNAVKNSCTKFANSNYFQGGRGDDCSIVYIKNKNISKRNDVNPIVPSSTIICSGTQYTVTSFIARGGEGEVWKVNDNNGNDYILKILASSKRLEDKKRNIKALFARYPLSKETLEKQDFFAAFPVAVYEEDGKFGYIARFCKGKEINELMLDGTLENMSIDERIKLIKKFSNAVAWFHANGLCCGDLSYKNFIYDTEVGKISVIDCDNVTPNAFLDQVEVVGTGFYIAPEVAFGEQKHSIESELYALAVLFFKIMVGKCDSPYHGNLLYKAAAGCLPQDMIEAAEYKDEYGKDWILFIFDEENTKNAIDVDAFVSEKEKAIQQSFIENWNKTPDWVKKLFIRAFNNPFDKEARRKRPTAQEWLMG